MALRTRSFSAIAVLLAAAVVTSAGVAETATTAVAAGPGPQPTLVRTIGGPGHATIYPSGAEIDWSSTDGTLGAYVVADTGNDRVVKYDSTGALLWSVGGSGSKTSPIQFSDPRDVGIDQNGNIYVADTSNVRIVKLDPNGNYLTSWQGTGLDKISSPMGITVSLTDHLVYVADAGKKVVRVYDQNGAPLRTIGSSAGCVLTNLRDVDAGPGGNVFIANYTKNDIVEMSSVGACIRTWGTKGSGAGQFKNPYGVRVAPDPLRGGTDEVFVADSNNGRIQEFTQSGAYLGGLGTQDTVCTNPAKFCSLRRVAVGPSLSAGCPNVSPCFQVVGSDLWGWKLGIWTADSLDGSGHDVFDAPNWSQNIPAALSPPPGATPLNLFAAGSTPTAIFNRVRQVAIAADGSLRIADSVNQRIVWTDRFGSMPIGSTWVDGANPATEQGTCGQRGWSAGSFNWPRGVAIDAATGDLWVADTKQSDIQVIHADCTGAVIVGKAGPATNQFNWPYQVAIRQSDRVAFVADTMNNRVVAYDVATRAPIVAYGLKGTGTGRFNRPSGITVGPGGHVFVADETNDRIVELSYAAGVFSWVGSYTGAGSLKKPDGVAVDPAGLIYVADTGHNQLVVLNADGSVYSVFQPTGPAAFSSPQAVTVDSNACIYLSNTYSDVIDVYSYSPGSCT